MINKYTKFRKDTIINIFVLIQIVFFLVSLLTFLISEDGIISFYSVLIFATVFIIMILEMIILFAIVLFKGHKLKDKVFAIFMICLFTIVTYFGIFELSKNYKDVPCALWKNYSEVSAKCTKVHENHGRGAHLEITVGNMDFDLSLEYKDSIKKGNYYRIVYLPNTKIVIGVYDDMLNKVIRK